MVSVSDKADLWWCEVNWSLTVESNGRISCESCFVMTQMSTLDPEPRSPSTPAIMASRTSCMASCRCRTNTNSQTVVIGSAM